MWAGLSFIQQKDSLKKKKKKKKRIVGICEVFFQSIQHNNCVQRPQNEFTMFDIVI